MYLEAKTSWLDFFFFFAYQLTHFVVKIIQETTFQIGMALLPYE